MPWAQNRLLLFLLRLLLRIHITQRRQHRLPLIRTRSPGLCFRRRRIRLKPRPRIRRTPTRIIIHQRVRAPLWQSRPTRHDRRFRQIHITNSRYSSFTDPTERAPTGSGTGTRTRRRRRSVQLRSGLLLRIRVFENTIRVLPTLVQGLEQIDAITALNLQLTDGFLEGFFGFGLGDELCGEAIGVVVVDCFEGGAPGSQGLVFVVLAGSGG